MVRQASIEWAQAILAEPEQLVLLDTETTGVDKGAEVIDLAVIDGTGAVLLDTLVRPIKAIPPGATAVHGIDDAMVAEAPRWTLVYPYLHQILEEHPRVVIYNLQFDLNLINQTSSLYGLAKFNFHQHTRAYQWDCAMLRYSEFAGDWNDYHGNYKWHKLGNAIQAFGIEVPDDAHRALADAQSTLKLVQAMAQSQ